MTTLFEGLGACLIVWILASLGLLRLVMFFAGLGCLFGSNAFVGACLVYAAIWPEELHD